MEKTKYFQMLGVIIIVVVVLTWVILIWLGNTIIVYSDPESLYNSQQTAFQTDFVSKFYFVGYVLSGMGHGDYSPATDWWKIYTGFISFFGIIFLSLAISFLIPLIGAVTSKRSCSLQISALGSSPEDIITRYWKNNNVGLLVDEINDIKTNIFELSQLHLSYPAIHYFHSSHRHESISVCIAMLDETVKFHKVVYDNLLDYYLSKITSYFLTHKVCVKMATSYFEVLRR